ncbi:hypothetical protein MNBD_NITROSPINAE04-267 [hydrothermal vent metagenome]|uniref:FecR protein domain-containing protein n=1 Tax=hydrothermal vent metagenome TaxID=652676 RepID=A0A3B1C9N3_9ZZZZ
MTVNRGGIGVALAFALGLSLVFATSSYAAPITARAIVVEGMVTLFTADKKAGQRVTVDASFAEGDRVVTGDGSALEIEFGTGDRVRVDESSEMTIQSLHRDDSGSTFSIFNLALGRVRSFVTKLASGDSKFEYHTKTAIAGVAGTDFVVEVPDDNNSMVVFVLPKDADLGEEGSGVCQDKTLWDKGTVYVKGFDSAESSVDVLSCFMTTILSGMAPGRPVIIPDSIIFGAINNLPFSRSGSAVSSGQEQAMMENIRRRVAVPLVTSATMDNSLQRLDRQYDQGQGTSTSGGGSGSGGAPLSPLVTGSITINIGQ